jgi:hypothetical protein
VEQEQALQARLQASRDKKHSLETEHQRLLNELLVMRDVVKHQFIQRSVDRLQRET